MGLDALFGAVAVIVEELRPSLDLPLSHENKARIVLFEVYDFGLEVGTHAGMIHKASKARSFFSGVDAEIETGRN